MRQFVGKLIQELLGFLLRIRLFGHLLRFVLGLFLLGSLLRTVFFGIVLIALSSLSSSAFDFFVCLFLHVFILAPRSCLSSSSFCSSFFFSWCSSLYSILFFGHLLRFVLRLALLGFILRVMFLAMVFMALSSLSSSALCSSFVCSWFSSSYNNLWYIFSCS